MGACQLREKTLPKKIDPPGLLRVNVRWQRNIENCRQIRRSGATQDCWTDDDGDDDDDDDGDDDDGNVR
jgi:hypothetical protein